MTQGLFYASLHGAWVQALTQAANDVHELDREKFAGLGRENSLREIALRYSLDVAWIDATGTKGRRREKECYVNDGWGGRRRIKQTWLDVTIPFTGDAKSLPSRLPTFGEHLLILSIEDNDNVQSEVNLFVSQVSRNLDVLRTDFERFRPLLEQAIRQAVEERKRQNAAENERDKKLSFPVFN